MHLLDSCFLSIFASEKMLKYLIYDTLQEPESNASELTPLQKLESCILGAVKNNNGDVSCKQDLTHEVIINLQGE